MNQPQRPQQLRRNRLLLVALFAIFLGSLGVAGVLRLSGWRPAGMKNYGELLQPPGDLRASTPALLEGGAYPWNPRARLWRIVIAPPERCGVECPRVAEQLYTVWQLAGQDADRVHVLWLCPSDACPVPQPLAGRTPLRRLRADAVLRAGLPRSNDPAGTPVYIVDPNGFVILRYAPGFDPAGLRADLAKLLKLM
jgi:hypothetical protein